jgi:glycosyltransferase involved in cell wall biosynthesis
LIIHLFNSALVSGPETLVIPALTSLGRELGCPVEVGFLSELRRGEAARAPVEYAKSFGLATFEVPVGSPLDPAAVRALAQALEQKRPALVHAHDVKASAYLAAATLFLRYSGRPPAWKLVSTHHGIHARSGSKVRVYELFYRRIVLRKFDATLCVCTSDREILLRQGLNPRRVFTHLNGVDRPELAEAARPARQTEIRSRWALDLGVDCGGKTVLGIAARLEREKNHSLLLESLAELKRQAPPLDWICLCFGSGSLEKELREKTKRLGLEDSVHWAGYRSGLSAEMAGLDCLISLSQGEGLPINLLEAAWVRTPILAMAVDGVQDLLPPDPDGLGGLRLDPGSPPNLIGECIQRLMSDSLQLKKLSNMLYKRVSTQFSEQMWRSCLVQIYQDIQKLIV